MEYDALEPEGFQALIERWQVREQRQDFRAGVLASLIANVYRDTKKREEPFTPADFFASLLPAEAGAPGSKPKPGGRKRRRKMSARKMFEKIQQLNAAFGGSEKGNAER